MTLENYIKLEKFKASRFNGFNRSNIFSLFGISRGYICLLYIFDRGQKLFPKQRAQQNGFIEIIYENEYTYFQPTTVWQPLQ